MARPATSPKARLGRSSSRRLAGVFDVRTAWRLEELIEGASAADVVELDFSHVSEYQDFGLAVLAQALKHRRHGQVALRGLREQQLRLLHSFGVHRSSRGLQLVVDEEA